MHEAEGLDFIRVGATGCEGLSTAAMLTIAVSPSLPMSQLFYDTLPAPLLLCCLRLFVLPSWCRPPLPLSLNAPSGGFGYSGMQSTSQSHFSYSLSQGSRARTPSSDVNEALYNLDRVLHGKSRVGWVGCAFCFLLL